MNFLEHMKLATYTGLLVALLMTTVDIISRIVVMSFEWFEFYIITFTTMLIIMTIFVVLGILIWLFTLAVERLTRFRVNKKTLNNIYLATAISSLFLFYAQVFVNTFLFHSRTFRDPVAQTFTNVVTLISAFLFLVLLFVGEAVLSRIKKTSSFFKERKLAENYLFFLAVFSVVCFLMDIYFLSNIPYLTSDENLEGYPNVLLIGIDTLRADHLGTYGYSLNTSPNIDGLAEEAVVFENAISTTSWTLPSFTSILTGKYLYKHGTTSRNQVIDNDQVLLSEILREKGYVTSGFAAGSFCKAKYGFLQGFMYYNDRLDFFDFWQSFSKLYIGRVLRVVSPELNEFIFKSDGERSAEEVNQQVFDWLDNNSEQPFFLFVHYFDPHTPYDLGVEFRERFINDTRDSKQISGPMGNKRFEPVAEEPLEQIMALYDTEIYYLDYHLGQLFDKMEELGLMNNTIIIITADHGEEFQEHGGFGHGFTLNKEVVHVPLIMYYPDRLEPVRIKERVSSVDILPTVLNILGLEPPTDINGASLMPVVQGNISYQHDYVLSEIWGRLEAEESKQQAIYVDNWKLIEVTPERDSATSPVSGVPSSLFNLTDDPYEQNNLYDVGVEQRELLQSYLDILPIPEHMDTMSLRTLLLGNLGYLNQ